MMGEPGGWPLTMALDADARPFWGGTYFPKMPQYGRPGLMQILPELARVYRHDHDRIEKNAKALNHGLKARAIADMRGTMPEDLPSRAAATLAGHFDALGGLAGAPKFPQAFLYDFIWRQAQADGDAQIMDKVKHALRQMCRGGLFDHIGGGFARYSVDAHWLVPHFEKMLYDNAQLIGLLGRLYRHDKDPFWLHFITQTIAWLECEMVLENGGFAASLDADSADESGAMKEGAYYVWTPQQVKAVLGDAAEKFISFYDISAAGNFEGRSIPNLLVCDIDHNAHNSMHGAREKLRHARATRTAPARDDKMLTDWNAMAITALAEAGQIFGRKSWVAMAEKAFAAVVQAAQRDDGLLAHSARAGRRLDIALAADHGFMIEAACALYQATSNSTYLNHGEGWADRLDAAFANRAKRAQSGGYFATERGNTNRQETPLVRTRPIHDNAQPSANAAILTAFATLFAATGKPHYRRRADALFDALAAPLETQYTSMTSLLAARHRLHNGVGVTIIAAHKEAHGDALYRAACAHAHAGVSVLRYAAHEALPADHPAYGKSLTNGRATAYICPGLTCLPPVTDVTELIEKLDSLK